MTEKGGALSFCAPEETRTCAVAPQPETSLWFAVQTRPRHEKKVNMGLKEKGLRSFLPVRQERRKWSDRQKWIELPLFSQYVFVRLAEGTELRTRVLRMSGVVRFAGAGGRGTPIPDEQIENLQTISDHRVPCTPHEFLKVGERVRIRGGALNGIEGILASIKSDRSVVVSVDLIQKSIAIRIDGFEVERV